MKTCFKCGIPKDVEQFYKHPQMADGRLGKCKDCTKADVIANRADKIEHYREAERVRSNLPHRVQARKDYSTTPEGIQAMRRGRKAWVLRNPRKKAAETLFGNWLRYHKELRQPCSVCGSTGRVHGHHENYDKPLDVVWYCPAHHSARHKEMRDLGIIP